MRATSSQQLVLAAQEAAVDEVVALDAREGRGDTSSSPKLRDVVGSLRR